MNDGADAGLRERVVDDGDPAELLGAWALDALDDSDRAVVEMAIDSDPALRDTADELRRVVVALEEDHSTPAPSSVRQALLDRARDRTFGRLLRTSSTPIEAYLHQSDALNEVLSGVEGDQWNLRAAPYDWTVHGLVAHLLQIERYFERSLGFSDAPPVADEIDHLALGAADIERELQRPPQATFADWRGSVARIAARAGEVDLDRQIRFHQWPFRLASLFIARAFEIWTHADDVRRAIGLPVVAPSTPDVVAMADTSVRSLSLAVYVVADPVPDGMARVVLTGDGGGTWDLQLGSGGPDIVSVVADVVDYCRVAARRILPDELSAQVHGDRDVALSLLRAAAIIAV